MNDISDIPTPAAAPAKPKPAPRQAIREGADKSIREPMRAPEGLVRQRKGNIDPFELPEIVRHRFAEAGWSLEWKRHTVVGQGDVSYDNALAENHWQGVTTDEIPGLMPKGYSGSIIRDGLILMKRPAYLTEEARQEDVNAARDLIRVKEAQLGQTPDGTLTRDHQLIRPKVSKSFEPIAVPQD